MNKGTLLVILLTCSISFLPEGYSQEVNPTIRASDGQVIPDFSWLNQTGNERPKYVWENREDVIYHDRYYPDSNKMTAPELFPLIRGIWVFNRAMKWIRTDERNIIAYSDGGDLPLTGTKQVSKWYSDPENRIYEDSDASVFEKLNTKRRRDCAVLPSFQFHLSQHPLLHINVQESTDDWQFVVSIKGRSGPPLISSDWQTGNKSMTFDISNALKIKGYDLNYAELHFAIGTWAKGQNSSSRIKFTARLLSRPAVVGCLPVIRTSTSADAGVPISAIVTGIDGETSAINAFINGRRIPMKKEGMLWKGLLENPGPGTFSILIEAEDPSINSSVIMVRITDGKYWKHNLQYNSLEKDKRTEAPLTGSYQGIFYFRDAGLSSEQMMNSQQQWDNWNKVDPPGEHQHYWESLSRAELATRFSYLDKNGWDVVHLHTHYGIWERFDASGNLAPHGVEQFAIYVDEASRAGLAVQVTLSSYPYGYSDNTDWKHGTSPYLQTLEKGFKNEDWFKPENEPFRTIYHQYIMDFVGMFKDETSILSFSSSGEGDADYINGVRRFQDTKEVIRQVDTNHIIVSEPIHNFPSLTVLPPTMVKGYNSNIVGVRNYFQGDMFVPEVEMSVCLQLMQLVPNAYIAEGCFASSNLYTRFSTKVDNWLGTGFYRYNVRDWLYLGFVSRMPLIVTWDEAFTEDEHKILSEVRKLVTWNQPLKRPVIHLLVEEKDFPESRFRLGMFEDVFSRLAVDYRFISKRSEAGKRDLVINAADKFDSLRWSREKNLPAKVRSAIPFTLSRDYGTKYFMTEDDKTLVAYIFNKSHYEKQRFYLTGINHRIPVPSLFTLSYKNISPGLNYRLYDLDAKKVVHEGITKNGLEILIKDTRADYMLVLYPK